MLNKPGGQWPVVLKDLQINCLAESDVHQLGELLLQNQVLVIPGQNLTTDEELAFCRSIGTVRWKSDEESRKRGGHLKLVDGILRVTGELNADGKPGLFGQNEVLDWHANQPSNKKRAPGIWLFAERGVRGSRTSWANCAMAYEDLDSSLKKELEQISVYCGYKKGAYADSDYFKEHINYEDPFPLVYQGPTGRRGLYFPFLQIMDVKGVEKERWIELNEILQTHLLQERYLYHHDWEEGDVVISDQWLSIHKRWPFDGMSQRVLHRIAFDYSRLPGLNQEL